MRSPTSAIASFCFVVTSLASAGTGLRAQSVKITPGYVTVGVGKSVQYTATVTGIANHTVTWAVCGVKGGNAQNGRITSGGLYTAPHNLPAKDVTISALAADHQTSAIEYVGVAAAGPAIGSVSPSPVPVGQFTVTVQAAKTAFQPGAQVVVSGIAMLTTYVNAHTLKATGWWGNPGTVMFQVANPGTTLSATFPVTFVKPVPVTISPVSATVALGGAQVFTSPVPVTWSASAGTISGEGVYLAPATMPPSSTVTVTATGAGGQIATAVVTIAAPQTISPAAVSVAVGGTQQFTSANATQWTASVGSVSATGLYTAPAKLASSTVAQVTATGPGGSATATVTLNASVPVITAVGSGQIPLGLFSTTISGTGFSPASKAQINATPLQTSFTGSGLAVSGFVAQSGLLNITVTDGGVTSAPFPVQVGVPNALASAAAARRFLEQGAFGPTPSEANHVQTVGMKGWIAEQFAMPAVSTYSGITATTGGMPEHFMTMAVMNPDQLRQRVAFALSQIFVTSFQKITWDQDMVPFQNLLLNETFGNYRQLMKDVTLSPAMGNYLDMANNAKANPASGSVANENYAREIMQLFTLGTNLLNPDGTLQLDGNGMPTPTYSQAQIAEFARVYTGWSYQPAPGVAAHWGAYITENGPMIPLADQHDFGSKQLLNGYVAPAGTTPEQDLDNALDNIFNHPNMGPFLGKLMIQHLVKSNPSPAYVGRVSAAFNDNGNGVRGDMKAVVTAVLLDPEARANDEGGKDLIADGHLQEPALYVAGMVRAFAGQMNDGNYYAGEAAAMGEDIYSSSSVFNYYATSYGVPGTTVSGGEFQIYTPNNAILRANMVSELFSQWDNPVQSFGPGTSVDLTALVPLAANPATLVDALDLTLTHGVMPSGMKAAIVSAVAADNGSSLHQVQTACYLILTSGYYNVWH